MNNGLRIPDMVIQKFSASHAEPLKKLSEKISQATSIHTVLRKIETGSSGRGASQRTMASPQWDNDPPVNWMRSLSLAGIDVADFDTNNTHRVIACGKFSSSWIGELQILISNITGQSEL